MKLEELMVDTKSAWIEFPGAEGFSVQVANLARKELLNLRKKCTIQKFDRKTRQMNEDVDEEKFVALFAKATVKGWKGLTLSILQELILIDMKENDPETELDYSQENAQLLMQNSTEFDQWLNEVVFDLANFRGGPETRTVRPTGKVSKEQ